MVCLDSNTLQMMLVLMRNICRVVKKSLNYFQNEKYVKLKIFFSNKKNKIKM